MDKINNYINLSRKYRPLIIDDLIGQDHLVQTLQNGFLLNRIAHAFMLTGVRGVGKTTTARIIAKALNCIGVDGVSPMTLTPCGKCEHCVAIMNDNHMDVVEMDAASKTGVDDVREIIENGKYKPISARYKVFIIDEVHMLSKNAFNALLKTLEEPPEHLKFIFATTEIRKVPITVLSRCQRFDLKRLSILDLSNHLKNICKKEEITFDEESIFILAKSAQGSVRDSLSLLDQAIISCDKNLEKNKITEMLGQGNQEEIYQLFLNLVTNNGQLVFDIFNNQYNKGLELEILLEDLMNICHKAMSLYFIQDTNILDITDSEKQKLLEIQQHSGSSILLSIWQILLKGSKELKDNHNSYAVFSMLLSKILLVTELGDVANLLHRASNLVESNQHLNNANALQEKISPIQENKTIKVVDVKESETIDDIPPWEPQTNLAPQESVVTVDVVNDTLQDTIKKDVLNVFPQAKFIGEDD